MERYLCQMVLTHCQVRVGGPLLPIAAKNSEAEPTAPSLTHLLACLLLFPGFTQCYPKEEGKRLEVSMSSD